MVYDLGQWINEAIWRRNYMLGAISSRDSYQHYFSETLGGKFAKASDKKKRKETEMSRRSRISELLLPLLTEKINK